MGNVETTRAAAASLCSRSLHFRQPATYVAATKEAGGPAAEMGPAMPTGAAAAVQQGAGKRQSPGAVALAVAALSPHDRATMAQLLNLLANQPA